MGRGRPVPGEFRTEGGAILDARPRSHLPALCRSALRAAARRAFSPLALRERGARGEGKSNLAYRDIPGLCKSATLTEIEAQGWSLNPGRYVGVAPGEVVSDEDFREKLETLDEELEALNGQARELEQTIARNVADILEA